MTAEAVAMNKTAVAMAADSVVTIAGGRSRPKTFDTANKLFELVHGAPVGIMVFANAEINGIPWETVIKAYREDRGQQEFDTVQDYSDDFFEYLNDAKSYIFTAATEQRAFEQTAYEVYLAIFDYIYRYFDSCFTKSGRLVQSRLSRLVEEAIDKVEELVEEFDDADWGGISEEDLRSQYTDIAKTLVDDLFSEFKLPVRHRARLVGLAMASCLKLHNMSSSSGVVVAGFGKREVFPTLYSFQIRDRLCGRVRRYDEMVESVDLDSPGFLQPFAQDAMAMQWATGINYKTKAAVIAFWSRWIFDEAETALRDAAAQANKRLAGSTLDAIASSQQKMLHDKLHEFFEHMNVHVLNEFIGPLTRSIALLPKEELALVAESMVNLESLRQRTLIHEMETVGGEIDLALISRGDGFVWLRRKNYFSLDLNPTWAVRHGGAGPRDLANLISRLATEDEQ